MVSHSDSSTTTQSTWNCLNNIPSRAFAWLYGKLVKIATAIKNFLSGGSSSETQPVSIPVVERTICKTSDDHTQHDSYFRVPASFKTTPSVSPEAVPLVLSETTLPVPPETAPSVSLGTAPPVSSGTMLPVSPKTMPPVSPEIMPPVSPEIMPPASPETMPPVSPETMPPVSDASHEVPLSHRELELYNRANRRLPEFTGAELQYVCCGDVQSVLGSILIIFLKLKKINYSERANEHKFLDNIYSLARQKILNDENLLNLVTTFKVRGLDVESWQSKCLVEKISSLEAISSKNIELAKDRLDKVDYFHTNFEKIVLPLHLHYTVALNSKYQKNSTQPATEQEIRGLQKGVEGIEAVLTKFTEGQIGDQIAQDALLQSLLSGIKEKLEGLVRLLQIR